MKSIVGIGALALFWTSVASGQSNSGYLCRLLPWLCSVDRPDPEDDQPQKPNYLEVDRFVANGTGCVEGSGLRSRQLD